MSELYNIMQKTDKVFNAMVYQQEERHLMKLVYELKIEITKLYLKTLGDKICATCRHSRRSLLDFLFCVNDNEKQRAIDRHDQFPLGGVPHSKNFGCPDWEKKV